MVRFLLTRGAMLQLSKEKPLVSDLLFFLLNRRGSSTEYSLGFSPLFETACFLVDQGIQNQDPTVLSASMLENCVSRYQVPETYRLNFFKYLLKKGASLHPGSPLTACILLHGRVGLVKELLDRGADKDCYTRRSLYIDEAILTPLQAAALLGNLEVVSLLLREGANINAPAKGKYGATALQAICRFTAETQEGQARKTTIIQTLLAEGANVNAAPALEGNTALQWAASTGDLALAILFLRHRADVNAPKPSSGRPMTALDNAAMMGRLDVVKLLLNANALSSERGKTGYDGAIEWAELFGHIVVADLIREHAAETARDEFLSPLLSVPPRDWREYLSSDPNSE